MSKEINVKIRTNIPEIDLGTEYKIKDYNKQPEACELYFITKVMNYLLGQNIRHPDISDIIKDTTNMIVSASTYNNTINIAALCDLAIKFIATELVMREIYLPSHACNDIFDYYHQYISSIKK